MNLNEPMAMKAAYFFAIAVPVLALLTILYFDPNKTLLATEYIWAFLIAGVFIIIDFLIEPAVSSSRGSALSPTELLDSTTIDPNPLKYPLQQFLPLQALVGITVVIGVLWGLFYVGNIQATGRAFTFVPDLFAVSASTPALQAQYSAVPLFSVVSLNEYQAIQTAVPVAATESLIWISLQFSSLFSFAIILYTLLTGSHPSIAVLFALLLFTAMVNGALVAYVYHTFAYTSRQYAYVDAWKHFTIGSVMAGLTGVNLAEPIAHAMHNYAVVKLTTTGTLQAFQPIPP